MSTESVVIPALADNDGSSNDVPDLDELVRDPERGHTVLVGGHIAQIAHMSRMILVYGTTMTTVSVTDKIKNVRLVFYSFCPFNRLQTKVFGIFFENFGQKIRK